MKSVLLFAFLSATSVFSKSNLYQKVMMMQDDQSKDQSLTVPDSLTHVEELNFAQAPDQIQDQKVDKVDNFIENQMSAFIVSDKKETVLATGKRQEWNLFSHPAYPRYALRTKTGSKLCDPNVHQVSRKLVMLMRSILCLVMLMKSILCLVMLMRSILCLWDPF